MAATSRLHDLADLHVGMSDWILNSQEQLLEDASGDFPEWAEVQGTHTP